MIIQQPVINETSDTFSPASQASFQTQSRFFLSTLYFLGFKYRLEVKVPDVEQFRNYTPLLVFITVDILGILLFLVFYSLACPGWYVTGFS